MKITKEQWARYEASNAKRRKKSATLRAIHAHVTGLRAARAAYPATPPQPAYARIAKIRQEREMRMAVTAAVERRQAEAEAEREIRQALLAAAREARRLGFDVEASKDRTGRVSSYYARRSNRRPVRISDHCLPQTAKREAMRDVHGGGSPFAGEVIVDGAMSSTRLRRLLVLGEAGRL